MTTEGKTSLPDFVGQVREGLLEGLRPRLVDGAEEHLREHLRITPRGESAWALAERIVSYLDTDLGRRCLSPMYKADKTQSPLRRVVELFSFIPADKRDDVTAALQLSIGHLKPAEQAAEVARRWCDDREFRGRFVDVPPTARQAEIADAIRSHFPEARAVRSPEQLAREWEREFASTAGPQLVSAIAKRLATPFFARSLGIEPLSRTDSRAFHTVPRTARADGSPRGSRAG